jgi:hypothetical protein
MSLTLTNRPEPAPKSGVKRAVIYLWSPQPGRSTPTMTPRVCRFRRSVACKHFAERHGAVVVREYVAAFRRMIDEKTVR